MEPLNNNSAQGPVTDPDMLAALQEASLNQDAEDLQDGVRVWTRACFGNDVAADMRERGHRFLEEALELAQSAGVTREEVLELLGYTFSRPVGEMAQELGGVMITVSALANAAGLSCKEEGWHALQTNWTKIEKIREKRRNKPKFSPLPTA